MALGYELREIVPALVRFREQRHVGGALAADQILLVLHRLRCEVDFAAEDRFDSRLPAILVKLDRTEQVAVIGDHHRRHP